MTNYVMTTSQNGQSDDRLSKPHFSLHDIPQLWVVHINDDRILYVVWVPQDELKELGRPERGVDGMFGGDG